MLSLCRYVVYCNHEWNHFANRESYRGEVVVADASARSDAVEQASGQRRRWRRSKRNVLMILLKDEARHTSPNSRPGGLQAAQ